MEYIGTVIQIKVKEHIFRKFTVEISPNIKKEMSIQVEEAQRTPKEQYQKRNFQHNIIVKTLNTQNNNNKKVLKVAGRKSPVMHKDKPNKATTSPSVENLKARRAWNNYFKQEKATFANSDYYNQQSYLV